MSKRSNVAPIRPVGSHRGVPAELQRILERNKELIWEADAIAVMLSERLLDATPETISMEDLDVATRACDAISRILRRAGGAFSADEIEAQLQGLQAGEQALESGHA